VTWYKLRKENRSKPEEVKKFIASAPSLDKLDHRMKEVEELRDHYYELYCLSSYEGVNPLYGVYYELDTALKILREYLSKITR
jgi:hypothetical protein